MIKSNMYSPREIKLAQDIAKALDDDKSISFYLSCTKKLPHRRLRTTLDHVLAVPQADIWKSRAALFTHMVNQMIRTPADYQDLEANNDYDESIFG